MACELRERKCFTETLLPDIELTAFSLVRQCSEEGDGDGDSDEHVGSSAPRRLWDGGGSVVSGRRPGEQCPAVPPPALRSTPGSTGAALALQTGHSRPYCKNV